MQSVDRIWFERGEWKDISEKSLLQSISNEEEKENNLESDDETDENAFITNNLPPGYDIGKLRESVINKLLQVS